MLNDVRTMQATFKQTVYDNYGKAVQVSYGKMALERPGKFRWDVKKPIPQLIIANQTRLWIYDPDLEQVTVRSLKFAAGETPALLLTHVDNKLENDFNVRTVIGKPATWTWFKLTPKKSDNLFATIMMGFADNQIKEMRLQDHLGHLTVIQFDKAKINTALAGSLFVFKAPANVDVIDETKQR
jgi:outer membrane lipoprotein carrier protein